MSRDPESVIQESSDLRDFRSLAKIPTWVELIRPGNVRSNECPEGYIVLYEYPFKIGFDWPFSPLAKAFMLEFDLAPSQLMPQFWRVVRVVERATRKWDSPMNVSDLLSAYQAKMDGHHRCSLHARFKGDRVLVLGTGVNDRGWKTRYVFVRKLSLDSESEWIRTGWNTSGESCRSIVVRCQKTFHDI